MKCRAALYCRLSKEDIDKEREDSFSRSIKNQEAMLIRYARDNGFKVVKIYRDDDYSGLYEDRPGFCSLIEDARNGCFEAVIAKTQARFTRNMEHLEKYLHSEFIQWGVRFIGVVDHVDTDVKGNKKARQINGLVNEWYCEDLSESVRASFRIKQLHGEYLAAAPPYGYMKDPADNHHLVPDPYAAEIVRRIFSLYLSGMGKGSIAGLLTEEEILRPSTYKRRVQGLNYYNPNENEDHPYRWTFQTVSAILKNEVYIGHTVQNKCVRLSYKSRYKKRLPESEWIKVENTHEPIVEEAVFNEAQILLKERKAKACGVWGRALFWKKLYCGDCGKAMNKTGRRSKRFPERTVYACKTYKSYGNAMCSSHRITEDILEGLAAKALQAEGSRRLTENDIENMKLMIREMQAAYQGTGIAAGMERQEPDRIDEADTDNADMLAWIEDFIDHMEISSLNREAVEELIDRIEVFEGKRIVIHFRFSADFKDI